MDPDVVWHTLLTSSDPSEIREAALWLLNWLANGGFPPNGLPATYVIAMAEGLAV